MYGQTDKSEEGEEDSDEEEEDGDEEEEEDGDEELLLMASLSGSQSCPRKKGRTPSSSASSRETLMVSQSGSSSGSFVSGIFGALESSPRLCFFTGSSW